MTEADIFLEFYSKSASLCSDFYRWERDKSENNILRLKSDILELNELIKDTKINYPDWGWEE